MISSGRMAAITIVALGLGFVGGAWFISSGYGFALMPVPKLPPPPAPRPRPIAVRKGPVAVGVPKPAHFSGGSGGLEQRVDRTDLLPSPGCDWEIEPRPFRPDASWQKTDPDRALCGYVTVDPAKGGLRYLLIQSTPSGAAEINVRPVFFDEAANRMVPRGQSFGRSGGSHGSFSMREFRFDPFQGYDVSKVAYFAIERVVPDAARLLAEATQEEAKEEGVAILPQPRLGQPYPFGLVDVDGKPIQTSDFKGKAVVVSVSGPGGFGNIGLMTAKRLRDLYKPDEVAFVNISFDATAEEAKGTLAKMGPDGPLVVIPNDPTTRRLWADGSQVDRLPKFFLVDRDGVLRFVPPTHELQDRVDILFGRAKRPPSLVFDLRLVPPVKDASGIPTEGKNQLVVTAANKVLHFRIFDQKGKVILDTDETRLVDQAENVEALRKQLATLWPPHELSGIEQTSLRNAVMTIIFGRPHVMMNRLPVPATKGATPIPSPKPGPTPVPSPRG